MFRFILMMLFLMSIQGCAPAFKSSWIQTVGGYDPAYSGNQKHALFVHGWYNPVNDLILLQISYFRKGYRELSLYEKRIFIMDRQTKLGAKILVTNSSASPNQRIINDPIGFILYPENENLPDLGGTVIDPQLRSVPALTWFNFGPPIIPLHIVTWGDDGFNFTTGFYDIPRLIESKKKWNDFIEESITNNGDDAKKWTDWKNRIGWEKYILEMGIHRISPEDPYIDVHKHLSWDTQCGSSGCDSIFCLAQEVIIDKEFNKAAWNNLKGKTLVSDVVKYMLELRVDELREKGAPR